MNVKPTGLQMFFTGKVKGLKKNNPCWFNIRTLTFAFSLFAFLWMSGVFGCSKNANSGSPPPTPEVVVITAAPRDLPAIFEYVGQIAGIREVEIRPRISGILEHWNYREGSKVEAGQSLFTIDPAPFRAALAKAEADFARAEANLTMASRNAARLKPLWEGSARKISTIRSLPNRSQKRT